MATLSPTPTIQIDVISDVMCPWCIVGFKQVEMALAQTGYGARVRWHPFELNPDMGSEGENLGAHVQRKYGSSADQSAKARADLKEIGTALGIQFNFSEHSRIVNSFKAHILLDFAATKGVQHPLKLALFKAHFEHGLDVSQEDVLVQVASEVGLSSDAAAEALGSQAHADAVRGQQAVWAQNGISGVPTMIFGQQFMVTGAQGPKAYVDILKNCVDQGACTEVHPTG